MDQQFPTGNSVEYADAISGRGLATRVHNVHKKGVGLSVPRGHVGLYTDEITLRDGDSATLDGELVPAEALASVERGVGETHIGVVTAPSSVVDVTLTVPTDAQDANDVIAATQRIAGCVRVPGGTGILQSVALLDPDDQGVALTLFLLDSDVALGTEDAAISITDANAASIVAAVSIAASDYVDLINSKLAVKSAIGQVIKAARGSRDLYIALADGGSGGTWAGGQIKVKLGFLWD